MLDTDTKRRIDTARDILVGKVSDPKFKSRGLAVGEYGLFGLCMRMGVLSGHLACHAEITN